MPVAAFARCPCSSMRSSPLSERQAPVHECAGGKKPGTGPEAGLFDVPLAAVHVREKIEAFGRARCT